MIDDLLEKRWEKSRFLFIDCRYQYEVDGGHIKGSFNINDPAVINKLFFYKPWQNNLDYIDFLLQYRDLRIDFDLACKIVDSYKR